MKEASLATSERSTSEAIKIWGSTHQLLPTRSPLVRVNIDALKVAEARLGEELAPASALFLSTSQSVLSWQKVRRVPTFSAVAPLSRLY